MAKILTTLQYILIICVNQVYSSPECTDMVSLTLKKSIKHGAAKTADQIVSDAIIMEDSVAGSTIYYAYVRPICKYENKYIYNCLGLKMVSSYEELKEMSKKFCWEKEIHIDANCMLPTIRIINGSLFCQLEHTIHRTRKPSIVKVNLATGKIIMTRTLTDAKDTTICLRTRNRSWKPECSGSINNFNVHFMVDEIGLWISYPASYRNNNLLKQISINDFSILSNHEVPSIKYNERGMIVCSKLYILSVTDNLKITNALDLANRRNHFNIQVKLAEETHVSVNSWIQYNPKLQQMFLGRPGYINTVIFDVNKCTQRFPDDLDLSHLKSTFLWALEPSEESHIRAMAENVLSFFKITDINVLSKIGNTIISCPTFICNKIPNPKILYCRVKAETTSLKLYSDYRKRSKSKKKRLQVHFRIEKILEQHKFKSLSSKLHSLKTIMTMNFNDLKSQINSFRDDLGDYFANLAAFDRKKAQADIDFIYGYIEKYDLTFQSYSQIISEKIGAILKGAFSVVAVDVYRLVSRVAMTATSLLNPISWITDGLGPLLDFERAVDNLVITAVKFPKLITLVNVMRKAKDLVNRISGQLRQNELKHTNIRKFAYAAKNKALNNNSLMKYTESFLREYAKYEPSLEISLITEYGATLETVLEEGCDILFDGQTALTAVAMTVFAGRGDCVKSKIDIQKLMAIFDKMYAFQSELLEALASFVRAKFAESSAASIKTIDNKITEAERTRNLLELQVYSLQYFVSSEVHKIIIIYDSCNLIEYINGGSMPTFCVKAIENPFSQYADDLIAFRFDRDMCSDTIRSFVDIPSSRRPDDSIIPPGTIDMTNLYSGDEVYFRIPNKDWLVRYGWILPDDVNSMIVMKRFELYLPLLQNITTPVDVHVSIRMVRDTNVISPSDTVYQFDVPYVYDFRYSLNQQSCEKYVYSPYQNQRSSPDQRNSPGVCLKSSGDIKGNSIHPSIFAQWIIKASLSDSFVQAIPAGISVLKAGVSICVIRTLGSTEKTNNTLSRDILNKMTQQPVTPQPVTATSLMDKPPQNPTQQPVTVTDAMDKLTQSPTRQPVSVTDAMDKLTQNPMRQLATLTDAMDNVTQNPTLQPFVATTAAVNCKDCQNGSSGKINCFYLYALSVYCYFLFLVIF